MLSLIGFDTQGIDVTHVLLGLVTLGCLALIASVTINEIIDRVVRRVVEGPDSEAHAIDIKGLGMTMADGGKRVKDEKKESGPDYYGF